MKWWLLTAVLLPLLVAATQWNSSFVVAFGSCSFRYSVRNLTTLVSIAKERPDYFLHIGDVVYLDTQGETLETWYPEMDLERVRSRYR
jgi:phosphodiesterase/alkaline phosphatase D-like protein